MTTTEIFANLTKDEYDILVQAAVYSNCESEGDIDCDAFSLLRNGEAILDTEEHLYLVGDSTGRLVAIIVESEDGPWRCPFIIGD